MFAGLRAHSRALWQRCGQWLQSARRTREQLGQESAQSARRAESRALSLLLELLDEEQRQEFQLRGFFHVKGGSSGERYRIRVDSVVNIDVLGEDGCIRYHLCARPAGNIPVYDVMAGQLLYLQDSVGEKRFLDRANRHVTLRFPALLQ